MTTKREDSLIQTAAEIWQDTPEDLAFQHVVLCHLGFPRSKTEGREFERSSGNASLLLEAGKLWTGQGWEPQPLPYGSIPRLMMIAITTTAIQGKTRHIELGRSMSDSLRQLGLADTGAAHWRRVRVQACALSAMNMKLGYKTADGMAKTIDAKPIDEFEAWVHKDERQLSLMPSMVELSDKFFNALEGASVPLDVRAVRALGKYPLALDVYTWLAHRLCRVKRRDGDRIPWLALREQFGREISDQKKFKQMMRDALKRAQLVYPNAKLDTWGSGITLLPSPPPVQKTQVLVSLPRKLTAARGES
jgi:hypothetical protein